MNAQLQITNYSDPLAQQLEAARQQMDAKCSEYAVTFGLFKSKSGSEYFNVMVVLKDKSGKPCTRSFPAASFPHMLQQVNELIATIK